MSRGNTSCGYCFELKDFMDKFLSKESQDIIYGLIEDRELFEDENNFMKEFNNCIKKDIGEKFVPPKSVLFLDESDYSSLDLELDTFYLLYKHEDMYNDNGLTPTAKMLKDKLKVKIKPSSWTD